MSDNAVFWKSAGRILNSGQTRSLVLTGNINDLFRLEDGNQVSYAPLIDVLANKWSFSSMIVVVYELNGPIRFARPEDKDKVRDYWLKWRTGMDTNDLAIKKMISYGRAKAEMDSLSSAFDDNLLKAIGKPSVAFELLRQLCLCSRTRVDGKPLINENLIIIIEGADMAIPAGEIPRMSDGDRHRVNICHDWFSDPGFMEGEDSVILVAESRSMLNQRIAQLPQLLEVEIGSPNQNERARYIDWFNGKRPEGEAVKSWGGDDELARFTAGLSLHALRQLLVESAYLGEVVAQDKVIAKVEDFIQSQLGEDIVEFKKPHHTLEQVVGFSKLKAFLKAHLIPRFKSSGKDALPGAAVGGPIGSGKTFIFEAVSAELDMVVLVLKSIRSQWYGQTDVIFERLRRVLEALSKVMIFVDEADTQFGGVGQDAHATERRLTGKIQAMMSDPRLRGKVVWLLMTARIHLLSPDIRRPGRVGDLINPILDPEGEDKEAFLRWMVSSVMEEEPTASEIKKLEAVTPGYSSAGYASLRSEFKAVGKTLTMDEILELIHDHIPPAIGKTRRYQALQALVNCTRRSLLPDPEISDKGREAWQREIEELEREGIR